MNSPRVRRGERGGAAWKRRPRPRTPVRAAVDPEESRRARPKRSFNGQLEKLAAVQPERLGRDSLRDHTAGRPMPR